ncbi:OVARIAN TUMOR DOMAIN-containing deubiquitinating enzyme 7-like isoform X2 [Musa acuminata AAA Group]|uniref:OVARIAN TUMOR DOMAIN-containing deubiquitinating enzyme 7-like isoform X2 n=1 Tax=Musa acuminata AAA Group TaxID=214697 RepID=UPI0031CEF5D5
MVQAKNNHANKKSKPRRQQDTVKKQGMQADISELCAQLDALGLKIIQVTADGNCFFRALADQLEGNENDHQKYREMVVNYIFKNREDFEPFIEDDVPFDKYCQSMEKDGSWAGHMELQAASLVTKRNICIHRLKSPRWYICNFSGDHQANMIHLCYHDGEHYCSVRSKEDSCEGPAKPIMIKADAHISAKEHNNKIAIDKSSKGSSSRSTFNSGSVKLVMAGTGIEDIDKVEQVLREVDGDVDAAIEFLIAEKELDLDHDACSSADNSKGEELLQGECQIQDPGQAVVASLDMKLEQDICDTKIQAVQADSIHNQNKKNPENKMCSCGSKKKCKACGTSTGKVSSFIVNSKHAVNKGRREPKQNKRKEAINEVRNCGSGSLSDMGALCI